ncbi:hypothetical protein GIB67_021984 [Kingdonia uniflora]|uniref:Cupin type-1 domain-containing protein n=1 Tax=Kingdonia uniflora TaxID=39325 RepID=A0A7J7P8L6_9MAGN|nr:hypothetical protein GIB67_021984 [Kingdonia uniflora]
MLFCSWGIPRKLIRKFTNLYLTGSNGIFTGFSTEFVSPAWDLEEEKVKVLVESQTNNDIIQAKKGFSMPEPKEEHRDRMALNCEEVFLYIDIKNGGRVVVLETKNLPLVGEVGLGADLVRLDGSAMYSPGFSCDSAYQVTYIVRGSGRVQVVGVDGHRILKMILKAGNLFIVPRFIVVSKIVNPEGMEWFSIINTLNCTVILNWFNEESEKESRLLVETLRSKLLIAKVYQLKVGLLDADIYGPSILTMMKLSGKTKVSEEKDAPIVWRGPMIMSALQKMTGGVAWGNLDILVVDMCPGTGDAQLTISQRPQLTDSLSNFSDLLTSALIVSTLQDIALIDARRGAYMFCKVEVPIRISSDLHKHLC